MPGTDFKSFVFAETGDTSKTRRRLARAPPSAARGARCCASTCRRPAPTARTVKAVVVGDQTHASFDNVTFLDKKTVLLDRGPRRHAAPAGQRARLALVLRHHQAAGRDQRRRQAPRRPGPRPRGDGRHRAQGAGAADGADPQRRRQRADGHPRVRRLDLALGRSSAPSCPRTPAAGARGGCSSPASTGRTSPTRSSPPSKKGTGTGDGLTGPCARLAAAALLLAAPPASRGCGGAGHASDATSAAPRPSRRLPRGHRPRAPARQRLPHGPLPAGGDVAAARRRHRSRPAAADRAAARACAATRRRPRAERRRAVVVDAARSRWRSVEGRAQRTTLRGAPAPRPAASPRAPRRAASRTTTRRSAPTPSTR